MEHKCKAIGLDKNEWVYGYVAFDSKKENAVIIHKQGINEMQCTAVNPETVCRFTGQKDINGKEIYKGDTLDSGGEFGYLGEIVFVTWNKDELAWVVSTKDNDFRDRLRSCFADKSIVWEVIGNIYDNPDLLPEKNVNN